MLRKSLLLVLLLVLTATIQAQNSQLQFDKANALLQQGNIVQALDIYQQLATKKQASGALFINMGYANLQLGQLGEAKYYYLKAKLFDETGKQAESGLAYVNSKLSHKSVVLPPLPWDRALNWLHLVLGTTLLLGLGLVFINIGVLILAYKWLLRNYSSLLPKITAALVAFGVIIIAISFFIDYRQQRYSKAVMVTVQTNVMQQPSTTAALVNKAYEGYSFTVDTKKSDGHEQWVYIRMSNGSWGWIQSKEIMIL